MLVVVTVIPQDVTLDLESQRVEVRRLEHLIPNIGIASVIRSAANIRNQLHDGIAVSLLKLGLKECHSLLQSLVFLRCLFRRLQPVRRLNTEVSPVDVVTS